MAGKQEESSGKTAADIVTQKYLLLDFYLREK